MTSHVSSSSCLALLLALAACVFSVTAVDVQSSCSTYITPDGSHAYDLTLLTKPVNAPYRTTGYDKGGATQYTFEYNVCAEVICPGQKGTAAGACQQWTDSKKTHFRMLGEEATVQITLLDASRPDGGISLSYVNGDECRDVDNKPFNRTFTVNLFCGEKDTEGVLSYEGEGDCDYHFSLDSPFGCAVPYGSGSTTTGGGKTPSTDKANIGLVLAYIAGSLVLLYFIGGFLVKFLYLGARGTAAIPNNETWGAVVTCGGRCCQGNRGGAHGVRGAEGFMIYNDDI